jgi:hypothetical protein
VMNSKLMFFLVEGYQSQNPLACNRNSESVCNVTLGMQSGQRYQFCATTDFVQCFVKTMFAELSTAGQAASFITTQHYSYDRISLYVIHPVH